MLTKHIHKLDQCILITEMDMETGALLSRSMIRVDKVYSFDKQLVIKNLGKLSTKKFIESLKVLNELLTN